MAGARFADALAIAPDLVAGARAAAAEALDALAAPVDLACAFVSGDDPDEAADAALAAIELTGAAQSLGCTAAGVIGGGRGVESVRAVSVWVASLPGARLRTFHLEVMRASEGMAVVGMPERHDDDAAAVLLADPYSFPVDGFVQRTNDALSGLRFAGGIAHGVRGPGSTRLFVDGRAVDRGAAGVLLGGDVQVRTAVSQGCRPVGPEMVVTRAEGNVLLELAGAPALVKLEDVVASLDPLDQALVSRGLQIGIAVDEYAEEHEQGDFLIRGIAGADRDRNALVVGDLMEVGRTVRFQVRDADAADADLDAVLARLPRADGALLFSCNGRGRAMFASADHDVAAVQRRLAPRGVAGFFAGGEIGPVGGRNYVHGFTASMLLFGAGSG